MTRTRAKVLLALFAAAALVAAAPRKPKLVLAIVVDQFRYDYLLRFRGDYTSGLDRLLRTGAVFTSANLEHFPTVTAVGHSTFLSGATPAESGIIGNDWYSREEHHEVTSVSDSSTTLLGAAGEGSSPHRLLVSTVGDELKIANDGKTRVIGISLKDRAAILPAGHMANAAYWFDNDLGGFVTSTYYLKELPSWIRDFNQSHPADRFAGATWLNHTLPTGLKQLYPALAASPFGNELIESFAERALEAERLGTRDVPDVLAISFSSNDYVGHQVGPDAPEVREMSVRTDKLLGQLFQAVDRQVGMDNVLVVLTADHGVAPVPEVNTARKMPGGRISQATFTHAVERALNDRYGENKWILSSVEGSLYLDQALIAAKKLDPVEVDHVAAQALMAVPHVFRVYTREELNAGAPHDQVGTRVLNGFYPRRSGDLEVLLEPYWLFGEGQSGTSHGTTFSYDAHIPLIFMGPGIRTGQYTEAVALNDVAPTLAVILQVETPAGSVGRVLSEIFSQ
jgi:predicted AlkP superfamily pyrophosphatase or phosphodiesterase